MAPVSLTRRVAPPLTSTSTPPPSLTSGQTASLVHHVFLPPKLPDTQEDDTTAIDTLILSTVEQALGELTKQLPDSQPVRSAHRMITRLQQTRDGSTGFLYEDDVSKALSEIFTNGTSFLSSLRSLLFPFFPHFVRFTDSD